MNSDDLNRFEDELHDHFENMKIDHLTFHVKIVSKLVNSYRYDNKFIAILRNKIESLFREKTEEVLEIICSYFNIVKPFFGNGVDSHSNSFEDTNENDSDYRSQFLKKHSKDIFKRLGRNLKTTTRTSGMPENRYKWKEIAEGLNNTNSHRRIKMNCSDYLTLGVCLKGDTCKFVHPRAALVRPTREIRNSMYSRTPKDVDYSSFILPKQRNAYDDLPVVGDEKRNRDQEIDLLSQSEDEEEDMPVITHTSLPKFYTPPSILDTPLWYEELGMVREISSSSSKSISISSSASKPQHKHRCLIIIDIPSHCNKIGPLNKHFRKFGSLHNISVNYGGDPSRALIEFRLSSDMRVANASTEAVLGNRFIRTRPLSVKKKRSESRRRESKKRKELDRTRRRDQNDRGKRRRHRSEGYSIRESKIREKDDVDKFGCQRRVRQREEFQEDVEDFDGQRSPVDEVPVGTTGLKDEALLEASDEDDRIELVICTDEIMEDAPAPQPARDDAVNDAQPATLFAEPVDHKLENAIGDSDVESQDSDETALKRKRTAAIESRRTKLKAGNFKNTMQQKMERVRDSMAHYKALLEADIAEFKMLGSTVGTKNGTKRNELGPRIKANHQIFLQLKRQLQEHAQKQQKPPQESCGTKELDERLANMVVTDCVYVQVPLSVSLDLESVRHHINDEVPVLSVLQIPFHDPLHSCFRIETSSSVAAVKLFDLLQVHNPNNWPMSLKPP